jgi:hypothetical protein
VAVGVVAGDAAPEPEGVRGAEEVAEDGLVLAARHAGVADLDLGVEEALLRREDRPAAVDVDGAALEDDPASFPLRGKDRQPERVRRPVRHAIVPPPVGVLRPAVEPEAADGDSAASPVAPDEGRAGVARPSAIGRDAEELHAGEVDARAREHSPRLRLVGAVLDQDPRRLPRRDPADDLRIDPRDRAEAAGPVGRVVRPADPGRRVRLPLRGHAVAQPRGNAASPAGPRETRADRRGGSVSRSRRASRAHGRMGVSGRRPAARRGTAS